MDKDYDYGYRKAKNDWRDVGRPSSYRASQLPPFMVWKCRYNVAHMSFTDIEDHK